MVECPCRNTAEPQERRPRRESREQESSAITKIFFFKCWKCTAPVQRVRREATGVDHIIAYYSGGVKQSMSLVNSRGWDRSQLVTPSPLSEHSAVVCTRIQCGMMHGNIYHLTP